MRGAFTRATFRAWSWAWSFSDPGAKGSAKARKAAYKQSGHNWHGIAKETNIDLNEAIGSVSTISIYTPEGTGRFGISRNKISLT